jgi:transcription termination factor NusA
MSEEQQPAVREFMRVLNITRAAAQTLVERGYECLEEIAYVPHTELLAECGLPEAQAMAIRALAREFLFRSATGRS